MRRRGRIVALIGAALVVLALLAGFAIELSDTQAKSRRDVEARVHERAVLAAALIESLLNTIQQQVPLYQSRYGARVVRARSLNDARQQNVYVALVDGAGRVLASSRGFTPEARAGLSRSRALAMVLGGQRYGLGNLMPYGSTGVLDFAVAFPTRYGRRVFLAGVSPLVLGTFLAGELARIPGVKASHNYLLDGNDSVLASNDAARRTGYRFGPAERAALSHSSGERQGFYYDQVALSNSTWRIVLAAPGGRLFAAISGLRKWVPWMILIAFALVAATALALGWRVLRSAEQDLRRANGRLAAVNRELAETNVRLENRAAELARSNAELDQFASIASHDLQEPLRKVRTFTEQLTVIDSDRLSEKGRDYLTRANNAAERMQQLIQDLLRFSRVLTQARPFAEVDLGQVAREALEDLSIELEESGAIVRVGELPMISADALQMRQLLQNLISNALKFRREGVVPEVSIEATITGHNLQLEVRDNGIGFEPQYAARIFRVFERLHGRGEYPGTGIGLALCRKIAERHGGSIVADGEPGVGSTFTMTLPLEHETAGFVARGQERGAADVDREVTHVRA